MFTRHSFITLSRNFILGVEDGIVSTVGLLSGVAVAGAERNVIVTTGMVLIFVEALSMAVGSFLSEDFTEEYLRERLALRHSFYAGTAMFFSYLLAGFIILLPYIIFSAESAFTGSLFAAGLLLVFLALISARFLRIKISRALLRFIFLGGIAVIIGVAVGRLTKL